MGGEGVDGRREARRRQRRSAGGGGGFQHAALRMSLGIALAVAFVNLHGSDGRSELNMPLLFWRDMFLGKRS